jgi:glycosyltransferase involved in cell wall biosynthesis
VQERVTDARLEIATRLPVDLPASLGAVRRGFHEGQVRALYGRAQVVAVATRPNVHASGLTVMLEGMACGRPVVVPDTPGMAEYVVPGETGLVYPVGDEAALAECVRSLLADPQRAAEMGSAGRRRVVEHYDTDVQARRLAAELVTL